MTPIILGLDPSKSKSGAALMSDDKTVLAAARVKKQSEREYFVRAAASLAVELERPVLVLAEEWDKPRHKRKRNEKGEAVVEFDQKWTYKTILGMGEGFGLWRAEFLRYGIADSRVIRVTPNTWRDDLFGKRRGKDTDSAKRQAILYVRALLGVELDDDSAEAVCLGVWGFRNPAVSDLVAKWRPPKKNKA